MTSYCFLSSQVDNESKDSAEFKIPASPDAMPPPTGKAKRAPPPGFKGKSSAPPPGFQGKPGAATSEPPGAAGGDVIERLQAQAG